MQRQFVLVCASSTTKVPKLAFFYTVSYKKTRPLGGGALFLEMYLLQRMIQFNVRNSLPGI
jgi:hypothetical protein